jgi:hypothetical protein
MASGLYDHQTPRKAANLSINADWPRRASWA